MDLVEYQEAALRTSQFGMRRNPESAVQPLLGLAGEAGAVLDVYKKYLRDRIHRDVSKDMLREELGDLLWYVAVVAASFDMDLNEVASENLQRARSRYGEPDKDELFTFGKFDHDYLDSERFPRRLVIDFGETEKDGKTLASLRLVKATPNVFSEGPILREDGKLQGFEIGQMLGDELTDNSRRADAYRYHDAIHMGFMAVLGWSPTMRALLRVKRKSIRETDEAEDGARAIFLEEGLTAALAQLSTRRMRFLEPSSIDGEVLAIIQAIVYGLEVRIIPGWLWRQAVCTGFRAMRELSEHRGGYLIADLDEQTLEYQTTYVD